jgi:DNA-binding transcriptional regulator YbjK
MAARAPGDTRQRILRATLRLIGEHGVGAVTNRRVAREAGVALGSLTYHFPDQTDLLRESLLLYVREEVARLTAIADGLRARSPTPAEVAAEVERLVEGSASQSGEQAAELELHLQAARDPALREASARCFAAYEGLALAALQALDVSDAEPRARAVVTLMHGLAMRRLASGRHDAAGTAEALLLLVPASTPPS